MQGEGGKLWSSTAFLNRRVVEDFKRVLGMTIIEIFLLKVG